MERTVKKSDESDADFPGSSSSNIRETDIISDSEDTENSSASEAASTSSNRPGPSSMKETVGPGGADAPTDSGDFWITLSSVVPEFFGDDHQLTLTIVSESRLDNTVTCVGRTHNDFFKLHRSLTETGLKEGCAIPPAPVKPDYAFADFLKNSFTAESYNIDDPEVKERFRQRTHRQYKTAHEKTVNEHRTFIKKVSAHDILRKDPNFILFLQSNTDFELPKTSIRGRLISIGRTVQSVAETTNEKLFAPSNKELDDRFASERHRLENVHRLLKTAVRSFNQLSAISKDAEWLFENPDAFIKPDSALSDFDKVFLPHVNDAQLASWKYILEAMKEVDIELAQAFKYLEREVESLKELLTRREKQRQACSNPSTRGFFKKRQDSQEALALLDKMNKNVYDEIVRFNKSCVKTLAESLIKLASIYYREHKMAVEKISETLEFLQNVDVDNYLPQ